ncbi:4-(cytidine 5'-diphospho)-2-C-methyl-D-erythritol kinase [Aurantibacillus circumpalustris]|uniref:4-(cytidine 5'-diphospho)-2-C-methyl-D-erythritol kinase n=1 Tax=Aurantibacillus circumpalustris TaxID=3036359 RepID=UPI00295B43E8|nr:4-(cytidine 5'-diphospho)-2-C-methyl-D-erythritol kinase [Aurantibacillus circumpalustris]
MIVFPNCKINLGLHIISKREDGFHNIETVFYPINWCDSLEVLENHGSNAPFVYSQSGLAITGTIEQNLIYKAWEIISKEKKLPTIKVHLHKNIPMGAGLGGGSSDAASFINLLNTKFKLGYSEMGKMKIASLLGSDCAFFINNSPVYAQGKGNEFSDINVSLDQYYVLVVHPNIHSNTKEAYEGLIPQKPKHNLTDVVVSRPIMEWKDFLVNDFESTILKKHPPIKMLKENLYKTGAIYASLSGSGSAVFGVFEKEPETNFPFEYTFYLQKPSPKIL